MLHASAGVPAGTRHVSSRGAVRRGRLAFLETSVCSRVQTGGTGCYVGPLSLRAPGTPTPGSRGFPSSAGLPLPLAGAGGLPTNLSCI